MENKSNEKFWERLLFQRAFLVIACGILIIVFLFALQTNDAVKKSELVIEIIRSLREAMIVLVVIHIVYEAYSKKILISALSEKITSAILTYENIISRFTPGTKKDIIEGFVKSIHKDFGNIIYKSFFLPHLDNEFNFRTGYNYNVSYEEPITQFGTQKVKFNESEYYLVTQNISYTKNFIGDKKPKSFKIGFVYNENDLEELVASDEYFFREVLHLNNADKNKLIDLSHQDLTSFVKDTMQLNVKIDDKLIKIDELDKIDFLTGKIGFFVEYDIRSIIKNKKDYKAELKFKIPQLKRIQRFLLTLPEPTYKPVFVLASTSSMKNMTTIPFFSETELSKTKRTITGKMIKYESNDWILERSGVLFVWEN